MHCFQVWPIEIYHMWSSMPFQLIGKYNGIEQNDFGNHTKKMVGQYGGRNVGH